MSIPSIAIVILNWNGQHYLQQFLPAVVRSNYGNLKVVVADNGSTDDSVAFLQQHFPEVTVIRFEENHGFAKGYNLALEQVTADYYLLLNSDVQVTGHFLDPLVNLLEANPSIAACQPKILSFHHPHYFEYAGAAGGWMDHFGYPFAKGRVFDFSETDEGQYDDAALVFWASGAALFIRSKVFHEVGGFDPYFFAHQEEIDLCWRIQLAGHQISSCPQSVVYHVGGGTLPKGNSLKTYLNFRNNHIMLFKNLYGWRKYYVMVVRALLDAISAFKSLLAGDSGYFVAVASAHLSFIKWILKDQRKSVFPNPYSHRDKKRRPEGLLKKNIAWLHFVKGKKKFSEIVDKEVKISR
ncbi:glycosyltransferase family 2 protein [Niabella soli]|uniref:Glycosyl transferase family 2 n=1 Tax=Niabella soli DSM 19437 TaxID=929713 RepID=W0EUR2_9BACT|nr:glycosyltransferase family 2 protein [Niabella soli]AHF14522.1 glycosyl transferase family 2 [Niabella soli DSM 19437]